jgi:hypothetical protein
VGDVNPITIEYQVTPKEWREASAALDIQRWPVGRPLLVRAPARRFLAVALFLGFAAMLYVLKRQEATNLLAATRDVVSRHPLASGATAGAALLLFLAWLRMTHLIARRISTYRSRITFDEAGMAEEAAGASGRRDWSSFSAWVETENLLILRIRGPVRGRPVGLYFPKRLFQSEAAVAAFKQLLADRVRGPIG